MVAYATEYDFVVVGGGTAGLVLAARLSEDPNASVLAIEAGDDHLSDPNISIPALWPALLSSDADWSFATTPQVNLNDRIIGHPLGRALGGSSALNTQAFIAPSEVGINLWNLLGNENWSWQTLSPYYKKCHTLHVPPSDLCSHFDLDYLQEGKYRGTDGPLQVSYSGTLEDSVCKAWIDTFRAMDYGLTGDPFSGRATGGFTNPTTVNFATKERSYSASAYYAPAQSRSNLQLMTNSQVEKVLFEPNSQPAVVNRVVFKSNGIMKTVYVKKECILAAGALNSPKILELSGVGNAELLRSHGIDVIIENPHVGENFQDHPLTGMSFEVRDGVTTLDDLNRGDSTAIAEAMNAYQASKSGPFSCGAINSFAFMPIADFQTPEGKVALQNLLDSSLMNGESSGKAVEIDFIRSVIASADKSSATFFVYACQGNFGADGSNAKDVTKLINAGNYITIACSLSYPLSRGSVHIRSASMADKPTIDGRYFSNPLDLEIYAHHVRFIETIVATEPLASLLKPGGKRSPAFANIGTDLDAAKNYIRRTSISSWHPVGTCAMKPRNRGGVVDERLIVHGSKNLRVVDASIMPFISRGNTQSTVYAVAERAADMIMEDHHMAKRSRADGVL